jgi:hypothetical protein
MKEPVILDQFGNSPEVEELKRRYVIVINNGRDILSDPMNGEGALWSTTDKAEANRMLKVVQKDFGMSGYIRDVEEAIKIIAKRRYDIDLKPPFTFQNLSQQIRTLVIEGGLKNQNAKNN